MKKVALSLLAFGLIGAGAFAQAAAPTVTIGDWGRQVTAFGSGEGGYWVNTGASWGGAPRIVGLNIQAKTDTAGFSITPQADNGGFGLTDQNKAWINPFPGVTIQTGISLEDDTWRGADGFGSWNFLRFTQENGDNVTFSRLGAGGYDTAISYNKDGIGAWALQHFGASGGNPAGTTNLGDALQLGGAYTIAGIGQIKAQYLGFRSGAEGINTQFGNSFSATSAITPANTGTLTKGNGKAFGTYQVAFNLQAVKGLYEEFGVQIPNDTKAAGYTYQVSDAASYTMDKTTFHLDFIAVSYLKAARYTEVVTASGTADHTNDLAGDITKDGTALGGGFGIDYDLGDSVSVNGDIRYRNSLATIGGVSDTPDAFTGFSLGLNKGFSNGRIGIAFEYASKGYAFSFGGSKSGSANWAIPLVLEQSF